MRDTFDCANQNLFEAQSLVHLCSHCAISAGAASEQVIPVLAAWLLLYVAAELFDAVEDDEFESQDWAGLSQAEALNVASACLAAIPLVLMEMEDAQLCLDLIAQFHQAALTMAMGQHVDLSGGKEEGEDAVARYWRVAAAKSGALFALACWAGARLGNPAAEVLSAYADFGRILGQLLQVCDDYKDAYTPGNLSDFRPGQASLPVVYGRTVAGPVEIERLEALLTQAAVDEQAASQLRELLDDLGCKYYQLLQIEILGQQAESALRRTLLTGSHLDRLLCLIPRIVIL